MSQTEEQFLKDYDASQYARPSVTVDMVIFTITETGSLALLLIRRGAHPYKDCWALPGGFLNAGVESAEEAAVRELREETGVEHAYLRQLYTFSNPGRDPRTHVISIAYTALVPKTNLRICAGDDAKDARLFTIIEDGGLLRFHSDLYSISEEDLAFDHREMIQTAIQRLRNRISYELDAFALLADTKAFTIFELKQIFEIILSKSLDTSNFRKLFLKNYVGPGIVQKTGEYRTVRGRKPAALFKLITERCEGYEGL